MSDPAAGRRLTYQPALDGLRGAAVVAVLLFHSDLTWARGGYLGVSTFFTLSGFLICSLLLAEHRDDGAVDLGAFWARRFRRLMPAALGGLAAAVLFGATVADSTQLADLRGDVLGALAYVANWRFVLAEQSYGDLFASPSPVLHYWSLAIEEQFYVLFPLLAVVVLRRRRSTTDLSIVLGALLAASVAASILLSRGDSLDRAYFGTDARAAELLVGALLATLWHRAGPEQRAAAGRWAVPGAVVALAALVACWATVEQSSRWLYRGGFTAYAVASAVVILGAVASGGPVRALLSSEPLRQIGRYSYGIYVFHWPIFQWLTPQRTELDTAPLLALRLAATAAVAITSFHLLEQPVRRGRALHGAQARSVAVVAIALVALGVATVTSDVEGGSDFERAQEVFSEGTVPVRVGDDRPSVAFYGDSTALMMGLGFADWQRSVDVFGEEPGTGYTQLGCGFLGATPHKYRDTVLVSKEECDHTLELWEASLAEAAPDVCVVMSGPWNVSDRKLDGVDQWRSPGDPVYDQHLRDAMEQAMASFERHGCVALWVLMPYSVQGTVDGVQPSTAYVENQPERVDRLNALVRDVVDAHPTTAAVVDLPAWMDTTEGGQLDVRLRPDLVHFGWEEGTAAEVAERFLGRAIYETYRSVAGADAAPPLPPEAFLRPVGAES